jgi:hypothetical protein
MSKKLDNKLKTALDETRLLFLGGQVLLGFQFQAFFQDGFSTLSASAKYLSLGGLVLMVVSMALLVAPVMQHRLVEGGHASQRLLRITTRFAAASLAPLAMSLALAAFVVIGRRYGMTAGAMSGFVMGGACALFWFGIEAFVGSSEGEVQMKVTPTPLATKVEQLLTEARVIIPGGQALFGFQFIAGHRSADASGTGHRGGALCRVPQGPRKFRSGVDCKSWRVAGDDGVLVHRSAWAKIVLVTRLGQNGVAMIQLFLGSGGLAFPRPVPRCVRKGDAADCAAAPRIASLNRTHWNRRRHHPTRAPGVSTWPTAAPFGGTGSCGSRFSNIGSRPMTARRQ